MEHLRFKTYEDLNRFLAKLNYIGSGTQGNCYLYKNKWTLKVFHSYIDTERLLQFQDLNIESFSFVKYLIYVGDRIVGVIAPFVRGKNIEESPLYLEKINEVINASSILASDVEEISYLGIYAWDTFESNIIYNHGKLGVIDTLKFYIEKKCSVLPGNISEVLKPVINSSLGYHYIDNAWGIDRLRIRQFLEKTNSRYKGYNEDNDLLRNPEVLLLGIKEELEEFIDIPIITFGDAKEPLKRKLTKPEL